MNEPSANIISVYYIDENGFPCLCELFACEGTEACTEEIYLPQMT